MIVKPAKMNAVLAPRFAASGLAICGTAKVVIIAVAYDQNTAQEMVGSRRRGAATSGGRRKDLKWESKKSAYGVM